ncbi:MAG: DUF736 domain-containing protein [Phenylobacterium zucineum]|nr:MAG: DUF736 domain-containing protein [Phenylobacterium zucineum]
MITIGTFTKADGGVFEGVIRTLTLAAEFVAIRPVTRTSDKAPDYAVSAGALELGAAWTVTREGKPECLSVRIDDPSFAAPVHGLLVEAGDGYELRWGRRTKG